MHDAGLPSVSYRISADYGKVTIMKTNYSSSIDVLGTPVNMCTKINHSAEKNGVVIGSDLYRMVKKIWDVIAFNIDDESLACFSNSPAITSFILASLSNHNIKVSLNIWLMRNNNYYV